MKHYWDSITSHTLWKTQGILREFHATSGKNCNKQSIFSSSFKYLCKTVVDWINRIIRISVSVLCFTVSQSQWCVRYSFARRVHMGGWLSVSGVLLGWRLDWRQTDDCEGGEFQERPRHSGQDEESEETPGIWGGNNGKCWPHPCNQTGSYVTNSVWCLQYWECSLSGHCIGHVQGEGPTPIWDRVATNLENLEYSVISVNMENSGNSHGISVQPQGKVVTNKVFLVRHSNICVKQLLTG